MSSQVPQQDRNTPKKHVHLCRLPGAFVPSVLKSTLEACMLGARIMSLRKIMLTAYDSSLLIQNSCLKLNKCCSVGAVYELPLFSTPTFRSYSPIFRTTSPIRCISLIITVSSRVVNCRSRITTCPLMIEWITSPPPAA
ncbi:hypothetical protein H206_05290 [Candidatus Electrothrix aarhusensis]|uniref:Uncharacterized protein n=1 Tax=Candidatus Electrothrix aarhusensis TaxID=1859131 RepID=A0A444J568_9BACT|nr:hypothetical protein H206_05290 [Candidatus Electrothrix aarhusensis]